MVALATAAAVLVAIVPLWRGASSPVPVPERRVSSAGPNPALESVRMAWQTYSPAPSLLTGEGPPRERYSNLAKETGQSLASVVLYVPGVGGTGGGILAADDSSAGRKAGWAGAMSEGLKPLTDSVSQTFNLLLGAWPSDEANSRS